MLIIDRDETGDDAGGGGDTTVTADPKGSAAGGSTDSGSSPNNTTPNSSDAGSALPPTYTPSFKFKYAAAGETNKQLEGEFDDFLKPHIKDAETEEKVRKLYAKAHGLDFVQAERDRLKSEYQPLAEKHANVTRSLQELSGHVQRGDFQSFFQALQIPEQAVLKYALERVQYHKMDPQQRAQLDRQRGEMQRASALEQQNQLLQQNYQQLAAQQRDMELGSVLTRPEIASVIQSFDERAGKPGAFKALVIQRGQYYALAQGVDMPPEQVVSDVLAMIGTQASTPQANGANGNGGGTAPQKPPVLPNVSGKGTSPAKKIITSTDQLRQLAAEKAALE